MDATIRSRSLILTVMIHGLIFLLLLFMMLRTPIPPFPESGGSGGVLVNIGYLDAASGAVQPMSDNTTENPNVAKVQQPPKTENEKILTSENEESVAVKEVIKKNENKNKKEVKATVPTVKPEKKVVAPVVDPRSLYPGPKNNSRSQGTASTGSGDQGDKHGDPNSKYTGKNGDGNGPGEGTGSGPGKGPGKGISFDLTDRRLVHPPSIDDKSQETGKVVVSITVDKNGTVTEARPGARGSTTTSSYLFAKAKEAAMKAKFSAKADGADIQKGTITFVFLLQ